MTHGNLRTPGGTEIPGVLNYREGGSLSFTADGATVGTFFREDEWTFTPDAPPLPSKPGLYAISPRDGGPTPKSSRHFILTSRGEWLWIDFTAKHEVGRGILEKIEDPERDVRGYTLEEVFVEA